MQNNKWLWILVIVVVVTALAWWLWPAPKEVTAPEAGELSQQDTTIVIEQELQATDLGNFDAEFQDLEAEVNTL